MEDSNRTRVALYIRVSTAEQSDGFSLDMQEKALLEHVERNGYKGWQTKREWIFIEQASGGDTNRKVLQRMLEQAKKKEFDHVLVWKIDRISRSLTDLLGIFEQLNGLDIGFSSLKEDIDFSGAIGKLIFQIFGALAEFERSTIKMRTEEGKRMSALSGNYTGGSVPFGYKKQKNSHGKGSKLRLVNGEARLVQQVFKWFVFDKKTLSEIAKELNSIGQSKGVSVRSTAKNTKWSINSIRGILTNDIYRGVYVANRFQIISKKPKRYKERPKAEWITSQVESAVSPGLFYSAQERLEKGVKGSRGGGQEAYMLAGKLTDKATNRGFVGYKSSKGTKNYRRKKFVDSNGVSYKTISIAASELERYVWGYIEKAINNPKLFLKLHKEKGVNFKKEKAWEEKHGIFEEALTKANKAIERVENDYYSGNIGEKKRDELLFRYEDDRDAAFKRVKECESEIRRLSEYDVACSDLEEFSRNMRKGMKKLTYEQKKALVGMLVEKIEIEEKGGIRNAKVAYRFDQRAVTDAIPQGRTDVELKKAKKDKKVSNKLEGGEYLNKGYFTFEFEKTIAYRSLKSKEAISVQHDSAGFLQRKSIFTKQKH